MLGARLSHLGHVAPGCKGTLVRLPGRLPPGLLGLSIDPELPINLAGSVQHVFEAEEPASLGIALALSERPVKPLPASEVAKPTFRG